MKKLSVTILFVLALALLVGCDNAVAGNNDTGNNSGPEEITGTPIDNLIGYWSTDGFVTVKASDVSYDMNMQVIFTKDSYQILSEIKNSGSPEMESSYFDFYKPYPLYGVDEKNFYTAEKMNDGSPYDGQPIPYEFKVENGKKGLYIDKQGPLYKVTPFELPVDKLFGTWTGTTQQITISETIFSAVDSNSTSKLEAVLLGADRKHIYLQENSSESVTKLSYELKTENGKIGLYIENDGPYYKSN